MEIEKQRLINHLVNILSDDNVKILGITTENERELIGNYSTTPEEVLTGFSNMEIRVFNRKTHDNFMKKIHGIKL